jgi:ribosomal subunit interface protein
MRIQHFEKGVRYSEKDWELLEKRLQKLGRYCKNVEDESSLLRIDAERRETAKSSDQVKVMVTVSLPKATLRAESRRVAVLDAFERCIEKLEPQIKRYKEKNTQKARARIKE